MRRTGIAAPESRVAGRVLQAKTGFVSLGHFASSSGVQQVVVAEGVHAVVVSVWNRAGQNRMEAFFMPYTPTNLCRTFEDHILCWIRGEQIITSRGCEVISLVG